MSERMHVLLAPIRLKDGIDEKTLLKASNAFQDSFVRRQKGILKRMLLRNADGHYADLVFFENRSEADRVCQLEQNSPECLEFFKIMQAPAGGDPDAGILAFENLRTYE
jgi:hypothetical protein